MAAKRDKSRSKSSAKKSLFKENVEVRGPTRKVKERDDKKRKSVSSQQTILDSFTILKQAGEALQEDISEESFNPPLHSTAVFTEDEDLLEKTKASLEKSANPASSGPSVSQEKRPNSKSQKNKAAASEPRLVTPKRVQREPQKTPQNTATSVQDLEASGKNGTSVTEEGKTTSTQQTPPVQQTTDKKSSGKRKSEVEAEMKSPNKKKSNKSKQKEQIQLTVWSPEDAPGTAKDVNELDVILFESEKLVARYRESVDGACRKAVDNFFLSYKNQLTDSIKSVRMLKDLKRKNAKVRLEIGRKQKRLIEVKDEIIKKQPKLNQLQKKYSELEEGQKSIQNAKTFLDNLGQLQEDYGKYKAEHPRIKETYGISSLPALILQTQNTMRAEQHFHNMNTLLQNIQTQGK